MTLRTARSATTASMSTRSKRRICAGALGIVLQDTHLFTGTVADNIRYGKLDATDAEVTAAAQLAGAHAFIEHLPGRLRHSADRRRGKPQSQGQRQLLAIARAAVADPPVLILDEATSSIDTRTERIVQEGMDRLMAGRTVFVIAHRLSTVRNSDCHHGAGTGPYHRTRHPQRAARAKRQILSALHR